jgi:hypothetical protein
VAAIVTEAELGGQILQLVANSDFLYIFGDKGVFYIANVQANGQHSRSIVTGTGGLLASGAATPFDQKSVFYIGQDGMHVVSALAPSLLSQTVAPTFALFSATSGATATLAHINGVLCSIFRVTYADPARGNRILYICCPQNGEIFFASQGNEIWTTSYQQNGVYTTYGTDGNNIYRLFKNPSALLPATTQARSKFYDFTQVPVQIKLDVNAGILADFTRPTGTLTMTIETELGAGATLNMLNPSTLSSLTWSTSNGGVLTFTTGNGGAITWFLSGLTLQAGNPNIRGIFSGYNIQGTNPGTSISAVAVEYQPGDYWL